jgi:uncharacterized protein
MCKFTEENTSNIENLLCNEKIADDKENKVLDELIRRKLVVQTDCDEKAISNMEFYRTVTNRGYLGYIIYPTMNCNFNCPYCYQEHENQTMSDETVEAIIKHARKNSSQFRGIAVMWFGGEPLLKMDIFYKLSTALQKICHDRKRFYEANVTTNGYYFTAEHFDKMLSLNTNKITITIDGRKETHDKQRVLRSGKGSYDKIIQQLVEVKNISKNKNFHINLRSNVSAEGYDDLGNYVKEMSQLFGDDKRFSFSFRPVYDWGGERVEDFKDNIISNDKERNVYKKLLEIGIPLNYWQHYEELMTSSVCYACRNYFYAIETNQKISKCTSIDKGAKNFYVGELKNDGTMIINDEIIAKWCSRYTNNKICDTCFFEANCSSNFCLIDKVVHDAPQVKCPRAKNEIDYYMLLLDQSNDLFPYIEEVNI